jgi:Uma2 family endonuclease
VAVELHEHVVGVPMAWEDYLARDGHGEYYDGLFEARVVTGAHQRALMRLSRLLEGPGRRVYATWGWRPTAARRRYEPDVMVIDARHVDVVDDEAQSWDGPVALLVEVLSPSNEQNDWVRKMRDYAAAGCPEYWIVSPWAHALYVYVLDGGTYRLDRTVTDRLTKWGVDVVLSDVL